MDWNHNQKRYRPSFRCAYRTYWQKYVLIWLRAWRSVNMVQFLAWERDSFLLWNIQAPSGAHPTSYSVGTGALFPRGKVAGAWKLTTAWSSAEVHSEWTDTSTTLYTTMAHKDNFNFYAVNFRNVCVYYVLSSKQETEVSVLCCTRWIINVLFTRDWKCCVGRI